MLRTRFLSISLLVTMVTPECLAEGVCPAQMKTLFFCSAEKSKKVISLCQDGDLLQYRYGTPEKAELTLPETAGKEHVFISKESLATGEEKGIGFTRGTYTYVLSNYFGGKPPSEFDHVVVTNGEKEVANIRCSGDLPTAGNLPEIADKFEALGYKVVER